MKEQGTSGKVDISSYALYDDAHFWIVAKYIERNPIKANIVYKSPKVITVDGKLKVLSKRIETFFEMDRDINRNQNMYKVYNYGYTKSDIAKFLEINPSTVSRVISSFHRILN